MDSAQPSPNEWKRGWRILLGATLCSGFGLSLIYYSFSLFIESLTASLHVSRGDISILQALTFVGVFAAPVFGWLLDRFGFARVFGMSMSVVALTELAMATIVDQYWQLALAVLSIGIFGVGAGQLVYTRPINAWFSQNRGLALGVVAIGPAITSLLASAILPSLIGQSGWQAGYLALAIATGVICLPLSLWLVRDTPDGVAQAIPKAKSAAPARDILIWLRERDLWLILGAMLFVAAPGAGLVGSLTPLVMDESVTVAMAAFGVSAYANGHLVGRIVSGWMLDRFNPRMIAFAFFAIPAMGFAILAVAQLPGWLAIIAVAMVGIQQGAEVDIISFFVARRFGMVHYGTVYGWVIATGWLSNAIGILSFGQLRDVLGSYTFIESVSAGMMIVGACLVASVRLVPPADEKLAHIPQGN